MARRVVEDGRRSPARRPRPRAACRRTEPASTGRSTRGPSLSTRDQPGGHPPAPNGASGRRAGRPQLGSTRRAYDMPGGNGRCPRRARRTASGGRAPARHPAGRAQLACERDPTAQPRVPRHRRTACEGVHSPRGAPRRCRALGPATVCPALASPQRYWARISALYRAELAPGPLGPLGNLRIRKLIAHRIIMRHHGGHVGRSCEVRSTTDSLFSAWGAPVHITYVLSSRTTMMARCGMPFSPRCLASPITNPASGRGSRRVKAGARP